MKSLLAILLAACFISQSLAQDSSRVRVSGVVFFDYFYNVSRDSLLGTLPDVAMPGAKDFNGFQIRRVYFTYDHDLSTSFMVRFRLEADGSTVTPNSKMTVALKDVYVRWKNVFPAADLYAGLQPTPAFEISENIWAYRPLEKTIMDLRGIVSPRDMGISLRSTYEKPGSVNYWLMYGNNSNNLPEADKYKRLYANLQWIATSTFQMTAYGDYNMRQLAANPNSPGSTMNNDVFTTGSFAAYGVPNDYMLGMESFLQITQNGLRKGIAAPFVIGPKYGLGISVFAYAYVEENVAFVGRYDYYDPNIDVDFKGDLRHYIVAGLSWKPEKDVAVTPNIQLESYENSASQSYTSSLTARLTFSYLY